MIVGCVVVSLLIMSSKLLFKKKRREIMFKFRAYKKQMIWNGFITAAEISYVNYCILLFESLRKRAGECATEKALITINRVIYITQVVLVQLLFYIVLYKTETKTLINKKSKNKIGALTEGVRLRANSQKEKYLFLLTSCLRAILVLTPLFIPKGSFLRLGVASFSLFLH